MEKLQYEMSVIEVREPQVFRLLFDTFYPRACLFASKLVKSRDVGADIAQETFLYIWQNTKNFPHVQAFKSYLYTTLKCKCLNYIRDYHMVADVNELKETVADERNEECLIIEQELKARILQEINKLPEMKREIMMLRLAGKQYEEISAQLHLSINTVKAHKKKSHRQLRIGLSDCEKLVLMVMVFFSLLLK